MFIYHALGDKMKNWESVDDILDYAIDKEIEAYNFYISLAEKNNISSIKKLFTSFAAEEEGHRKKLEAAKSGKMLTLSKNEITNLKVTDYLVNVAETDNMSYQDVLILAAKKEKAAFMLYTDLAETAGDDEMKTFFEILAQEEARHKLRFEIEYDNSLTDN